MSLNLTKKTTIIWATLDDMNGNTQFNIIRSDELKSMVSNNLTDGNVIRDDTQISGTIHFIDEVSAQTWISFVTTLAQEYNKTIVSAEITPIDTSQ
jgi:hypothetical protein